MKFIVSKLGKKAVSVICALAVILSVVSVAFGTLATGGSESVVPYTVDVDTAPAIPVFSLTQVDLKSAVEVVFAGDNSATKGSDITWTLLEGGPNVLTLSEGGVLEAYKSGTYKIKAETGSKSAIMWVVVANNTDSAWNIYEMDFDKYAEEKELSKYTFEADGNSTTYSLTGSDTVVTTYKYRTGAFKFNGVTFNQTNYPSNVAQPEGWHTWIKGYMNRSQNGKSDYIEVPYLMPYKHTGTSSNDYLNREVTTGVMPFDNPYMTSAFGLTNQDQLKHSYSDGGNDMKGYYILNNEIVKAFSDYTITSDMKAASYFMAEGMYSTGRYIGLMGRFVVDANGKPSSSTIPNYTMADYYTAGYSKSDSNKFVKKNTARTDTSKVIMGINFYGATAGNQYNRGAVAAKLEMNENASIVATVAGSNAADVIGQPYFYSNDGGKLTATRWNYIGDKKYMVDGSGANGCDMVVSVKYEGTTATMYSPMDTTQQFTFDNIPVAKGAVGVYSGNIMRSGNGAAENVSSWINLHSFTVSLNNDITAANDGSEYPVYSELDIYKILGSNPALPMYSGTYVEKGDFAVQGDDKQMYLGADLKFEFKNLDAEGNELDTAVIGVKDDTASGRIYAYKKGAYKAVVKNAATNEVITSLWVAVKDNKGEDWVLYDIDFDAIAEANDYADLTFEESGQTATVSSARSDPNYKTKIYRTGDFKYKGQTVSASNVPEALKLPNGWSTVVRAAEYSVETQWTKVPHVMPYSHTAASGASPNYTRKVTTGLMPFDNPFAANAFGIDMSVEQNVSNVLGENNYTRGYFILNNDVTKAFADYKVTVDMDTSSYNAVHGTFSSAYNTGVVGRLPVDNNGIPTDEAFAGYSVDKSWSGSSFSTVKYTDTVGTGYTSTAFLVNLRSDNKNPCGVVKYDSRWDRYNRWVGKNYIHGVTLKDGSPLVAGTDYAADNVTLDTWQYLMSKKWMGDLESGANVVLSVLYKGNTAVISSPEDTSGKTYTFDNVYSTTGAVGVIAPVISSPLSSTSSKANDTEWISLHHFTIALSHSDDEVPPYTKIPLLSEDNNKLELTVDTELPTNEIAIVADNSITLGSEATWNLDSQNVTIAGGKIKATKAGYFNGKVTAGGKTLDVIIAVKRDDGTFNTVLSADDKFVYITEDTQVDLSYYTALIDGKYYALDEMTATPAANSNITIAAGKLTAADTGYFTVDFVQGTASISVVFAVKANGDKFYENDNVKFTMTEDYVGAKNRYSTLWNDNGLTAVERADANAPFTQVLTVPDRLHNFYVERDWVNIYSVEGSFASGEYANKVKKLVIEKYIETIGGYAFANYKELEILELPERLKEIGAYAFSNNTKLAKVTLPATLTKIGESAFAGANSLTDVYVMNPDTVTIGANAFPITAKIHVAAGSDAEAAFTAAGYTTVALEANVAESFKDVHDDILAKEAARATTVDVGTWYEYTNTQWKEHKGLEFRRIALNNRDAGVLHVPAEADWTDDKGVTSVQPVTMAYINAFCRTFERDRIYEIKFPEIGYTFQMGICEQMSNLKKVTLPIGLISFSQFCFYGTAIEEIVIPATLRSLAFDGNVFAECKSLKSITFQESGRANSLGTNYIANTKVETLDLPVSVDKIHVNAFSKATALKRVNFYNKEAKIYTTKNIDGVSTTVATDESCSMPSGLTVGVVKGSWMETYALKWKAEKNLTIVYLDDKLDSTDSNAANYIIAKGSTYNYINDYVGIGGKLVIPSSGNVGSDTMVPVYSVGANAFKYVKDRVYGVELSEGLISIDEAAFKDMPNLASVKLPTSLKTINKEAFANCGITGTLEIPKNVATVSNSAFAGNPGITKVYFYNPATVIGADSIPETATIYGIKDSTAQAYAEKMEMEFVAIDAPTRETVSDVSDNGNYTFTVNEDGVITGYERKDTSKAYSLKVTFPSEISGVKVTAIGENVFEAGNEASSVYAVVIPEGVTEIGANAFKGNLKLTHVTLPKSLVKIGESAFEETKLIGDIKLSESVSDIGKNAFKGVNTLSSVTIENKACIIKASAFPRGVKTFTLYGYTGSTAANFAERNKINFAYLDGGPVDDPTEDPIDTEKDPTNKEPNNSGDVKDPVGDIGDQNGGTVTVIRQNDMTTVLIIVIAMLAFMMLMSGALILFIIIKGRQMSEE